MLAVLAVLAQFAVLQCLQCCSAATVSVVSSHESCRLTNRVESRVVSGHESHVNVLGVMRGAIMTPFVSQVPGLGQQQQQQVDAFVLQCLQCLQCCAAIVLECCSG